MLSRTVSLISLPLFIFKFFLNFFPSLKANAAAKHEKIMDEIAKMVLSPKFNKMLNPDKESEAIFKANQFLA